MRGIHQRLSSWLADRNTEGRARLSLAQGDPLARQTVAGALAELLLAGKQDAEAIDIVVERGWPKAAAAAGLMYIQRDPFYEAWRTSSRRLQWREWLFGKYAALDAGLRMQSVCAPLERDEFLNEYYYPNRPVFVRGAVLHWPAVHLWSADYLKSMCGAATVAVMDRRVGARASDQYAGTRLVRQVSFGAFVDTVYGAGRSNDIYLVAKNDFFSVPEVSTLARDLGTLSFVRVDCRDGSVKLWMGPAGTITPLHYDSRSSLLVGIVGRKRVRLFAPWHSIHLTQVETWYAVEQRLEDLHPPGASISAAEVILMPGDALFVPVGWWHEVESEEVSISVTCLDFRLDQQTDG